MRKHTVCLAQTSTPDNPEDALSHLQFMLSKATRSCDLMVFPETVNFIGSKKPIEIALTESNDKIIAFLRRTAKTRKHDILIGSVSIKKSLDDKKLLNRSLYIDKTGNIVARYDKIHLFDAVIVDKGLTTNYRESSIYNPGSKAVIAKLDWGNLGMTICYDIRQPQLYRNLAMADATIFSIPSAFTIETGKKHWQILCQARAIENGCFVIAPAQCGKHSKSRETWGHSLIIEPCGNILVKAKSEIGVFYADLDLDKVNKQRQAIPVIANQKDFTITVIKP